MGVVFDVAFYFGKQYTESGNYNPFSEAGTIVKLLIVRGNNKVYVLVIVD